MSRCTKSGTSPGASRRNFCVLINGTTSLYPKGGEICMGILGLGSAMIARRPALAVESAALRGVVAQLGERRVRNAKVGRSILLHSTKLHYARSAFSSATRGASACAPDLSTHA